MAGVALSDMDCHFGWILYFCSFGQVQAEACSVALCMLLVVCQQTLLHLFTIVAFSRAARVQQNWKLAKHLAPGNL